MTLSGRIGNFDIIEPLGEGADGSVYLAVDTVRDRMVAIKTFHALPCDSATQFAERIVSLSAVTSPFFATIFSASPPSATTHYLVREYVNGIGLAQLTSHIGSLGIPFAVAVGAGVAHALAALHQTNNCHGNINSKNIFLEQTGNIRLTDPTLKNSPITPKQDLNALIGLLSETIPNPPPILKHLFDECCNGNINSASALSEQFDKWLAQNNTTRADELTKAAESVDYLFMLERHKNDAPALMELKTPVPLEVDRSDAPTHSGKPPQLFIEPLSPKPPKKAEPPQKAELPTLLMYEKQNDIRPKKQKTNASQAKSWRTVTLVGAIAAIAAGSYILMTSNQQPKAPVEPEPKAQPEPAKEAVDRDLLMAKIRSAQSPAEELSEAQSAVRLLPKDWEANLLLAKALERNNQLDSAVRAMKKAISLSPERVEPHQRLVKLYIHLKQSNNAIRAAKQALELHGTDSLLHSLLGRAQLLEHRLGAAEKSLDVATRLNSGKADYWLLLGQIQLASKKSASAQTSFEKALTINSNSVSAYVGLGRSLLMEGQGGEAAKALKKGLKISPDAADIQYAFGRVHLFDGNNDEAVAALMPYTRSNPKDWRGFFSLGLAQLRRGRFGIAINAFSEAQRLMPSRPEIYFNLGVSHRSLGENNLAVSFFKTTVQHRSGLWQAHCELGRSFLAMENYSAATTAFDKTLELNPESVLAKSIKDAGVKSGLAHLIAGMQCGQAPELDIVD